MTAPRCPNCGEAVAYYGHDFAHKRDSAGVAQVGTPAALTERLIQAAVDYENGVDGSRRKLSEARADVETALTAPAQAVQQPVAYRWKYEDETSWTLAKSKPNHLFYQKDVICEPLYTLPSTDRGTP